jgi:GAF domain-containing protein
VADQLAITVENTRLFQELQERLGELETLYGLRSQETWHSLDLAGVRGYRYDHGGLAPLTEDSLAEPAPTGSPLSIPIVVRGQEIGSLEVWPEEENWTVEKNAVVQAIGERIGQAIESARLFDEVQARAARERLLSQLTTRFTHSLDFDALLQTAVKELSLLPNISEVSIQVGALENPPGNIVGSNGKDPG